MASKGGGVQGIPAASRKMVQSLKEIVNGVSDVEIYSALKDCNMDPNEAVNRLLSQDPFHEVKSKREKKKELKDTTESRPRGGGSTSSRGARSGTERYTGRGSSSQFNASESGGLHGKSKKENGTSSYTSSSAPPYGVAATITNLAPPTYSGSIGYENKGMASNVADGTAAISHQSSSGYQSAWSSVPGQKSMADIVKMGRPQNKLYSDPVPSQPSSTHYEVHPDVSTEDDWPVMEPPQTVVVQSISEPRIESEIPGQSSYERDNNQHADFQVDEAAQAKDENVFEDQNANYGPSRNVQEDTSPTAPLYDNDLYKKMDSFHLEEDHAFEHNDETEEGDASASSISANIQQLNIHEEKQLDEPEEDDVPSVVIPDHLQVSNSDCSHLSFGSFGVTNMGPTFPGSFASPAEADKSPVGPSDNRNAEYYDDESVITSERNQVHQMGPSSGSYDLPSVSQTEVLKQENPEMNQYSFSSSTAGPGYTFDGSQLLNNQSFSQSQAPSQMPNEAPFSNVMQAAYTNALPSTMLAANGHPVRESDLSYSPFLASQSTPTKYGSSIGGSTISISEALKTGIFSSSQPTQQTSPGNAIPTGPGVQQHLVHPYSQPTLPLGPYANMIGYPILPQSYTYMPSGFQQQAFAAAAGNSTYHQQLAAVVPQYKNSVSVSSLPHSASSVPSGYGSFSNSTGNYQANNQPSAGSTLSYDDALNAHFKETSQLLSLQQQQQQMQNENSAMWVHGAGSRTMPGVPASTYYSLQGQTQHPSGFRLGQQQQPSQSYGGAAALDYQNYYQSQTGISQEHQLQQNARDGSLVGGSQGQPKPQQQQSQQQLWQNSY
ncbi:uncharacterized protein [Rutidosis leptorrhynchoides]|uniref:uncharacterized protein isoform X2 n=1 Tax=Rutidosis leptorrhynchoides TaxID=125765 RepID=UPI003A99E745